MWVRACARVFMDVGVRGTQDRSPPSPSQVGWITEQLVLLPGLLSYLPTVPSVPASSLPVPFKLTEASPSPKTISGAPFLVSQGTRHFLLELAASWRAWVPSLSPPDCELQEDEGRGVPISAASPMSNTPAVITDEQEAGRKVSSHASQGECRGAQQVSIQESSLEDWPTRPGHSLLLLPKIPNKPRGCGTASGYRDLGEPGRPWSPTSPDSPGHWRKSKFPVSWAAGCWQPCTSICPGAQHSIRWRGSIIGMRPWWWPLHQGTGPSGSHVPEAQALFNFVPFN